MQLHYHAADYTSRPNLMPDPRDLESTLTDRYQTTVPSPVRRALKLQKRDKIRYCVTERGEVILTRATGEEESDPVVGKFLQFLARDMEQHPQHIKPFPRKLYQHIRELTKGVKVDLDQPLDPNNE